MKIHLPDVTLCALDTAHIDLTLKALEHSMQGCSFGDVLLIASRPVTAPFRTELIEPFASKSEVGKFFIQKLPPYIKTPFVLSIQYDGYVVNPAAWRAEFLDYDYIGAKWAWYHDGMTVGNSGFSLMSKKLLDLWGTPEVNPTLILGDDDLCRVLRPRLEREYGIRFAPEAVADLFSYENSLPRQPTFGFHGLFNLWRHIDDEGMEQIARSLADYTLPSYDYAKVVVQYYLMRKFGPLQAFYARLREKTGANELLRHFTRFFNEPFAAELIAVCENLMKNGAALPPASSFTDIKHPNAAIDPRGRLFPWDR
jgi:hypothetical protein